MLVTLPLALVSVPHDLEALVSTGELAPGTQEVFTSLGVPALNEAGAFAFHGRLSGDPDADAGIWVLEDGAVVLVAREGDVAPGTDGAHFDSNWFSIGVPVLDDHGRIAISSSLDDGGVGVWLREPGGAPTKVVATGDVLPDTGGAPLQTIGVAALSNAGAIGLRGSIGILHEGIFLRRVDGTFATLAISGGSAPEGTRYLQVGASSWSVESDLAFWARLGGPGVTTANNIAIVGGDPDLGAPGLGFVARKGDVAPGTGGLTFDNFWRPAVAVHGRVAFCASLSDTSISAVDGIWKATPEGLAPIVFAGAPAPGGGGTLSALRDPSINAQGRVAFVSTIETPGGVLDAVWIEDPGAPGGLRLVAQDGDPVPGMPGVTLLSISASPGPNLSDTGRVGFRALLSTGQRGLFATRLDGALELLNVEDGELVAGAASEALDWIEGGYAGRTALDDAGRAAFRATTTFAVSSTLYLATIEDFACGAALCASPESISVGLGGEQALALAPLPEHAGDAYWVLGSLTGTAGFPLLGATVPLSFDAYTQLALAHPSAGPLVHTLGLLDAQGAAPDDVAVALPPGSPVALIGLTAHHAALVFDPFGGGGATATNATAVVLVP